MGITLAALVKELEQDVAARDGVPSGAQYERAVKDAVEDFSERQSLRKRGSIAVVSGTASYDLPVDFRGLVQVQSLLSPADEAMITPQGIIPVDSSFREDYVVAGSQITFYPTPTYTATRWLWYLAGYMLDENDVYQEMTQAVRRVVMLKARAICLQIQADKAAQEAWNYQVGGEKVSKEKLAQALADRAKELETQYKQAVEAKDGPIGLRPYQEFSRR